LPKEMLEVRTMATGAIRVRIARPFNTTGAPGRSPVARRDSRRRIADIEDGREPP